MSSRLGSRLARLSQGTREPLASAGEAELVQPLVEPPSKGEPALDRPAGERRPVAPRDASTPVAAQDGDLLDDLRSRMEAILSRTRGPSPAPPPRVDIGELPFCVEETSAGPLHVRTVRHGGEHRVGRIPVATARGSSAELLALLALDPRLAACDPARALYLDTETTGLGPGAGTVAFLVGLAWFEGSPGGRGERDDARSRTPALVVEQLLVRRLGEEGPVLERVAERLAAASMLVTFNGKSFDMPVLRTRFVMGRRSVPAEPPHLDLLHVARRLHKARGVGVTLGAVEREVLGFVREDDVPSGEVSACYVHFLRSGDPRALMGVVEHNAWDVVSMAALVGLYGEPLEGTQLEPGDLVGLARTLKRAGSAALAYEAADAAVLRGAGPDATRARAEIAKARGDKARALADFEALAASVDDPSVRLELAKLYEHHAKDATRALEVVEAGTGEGHDHRERRRARLRRKVEQAALAHATRRLF